MSSFGVVLFGLFSVLFGLFSVLLHVVALFRRPPLCDFVTVNQNFPECSRTFFDAVTDDIIEARWTRKRREKRRLHVDE